MPFLGHYIYLFTLNITTLIRTHPLRISHKEMLDMEELKIVKSFIYSMGIITKSMYYILPERSQSMDLPTKKKGITNMQKARSKQLVQVNNRIEKKKKWPDSQSQVTW